MGVTGAIVAYVTLENRPIFAAIGVVAGLITAAGFAGQTLAVRRQLLFSSDAGQRADAIEGLDEIEVQFQPESQGGTAALEPHRDVAD